MKKIFNISLVPSANNALPSIQYGAKADDTKIKDLSSWLRAWTAFLELQTYFRPQLVQSLIRYQSIVIRFSRTFKDRAWIMYDQLFRQKVAQSVTLSWEDEDARLYNEVLKGNERSFSQNLHSQPSYSPNDKPCFKCNKPGHIAKFGSSPDIRHGYKFNSKSGCSDRQCVFPHSCAICKGGHPKFRCNSGS